MEFQLDIYGNSIPVNHIVQEKKCNERYKKKALNDMKKYLKKKEVSHNEKTKCSNI